MTLEPKFSSALVVCSILTSIFLSMFKQKRKKYQEPMFKKSTKLRNTVVSEGKYTWRQGARREAGAVILSSNPHLICMIEEKTLRQAIERVSRKPLTVWWRLWNVSGQGRLHLRYFSLLIDYTIWRLRKILSNLCILCTNPRLCPSPRLHISS